MSESWAQRQKKGDKLALMERQRIAFKARCLATVLRLSTCFSKKSMLLSVVARSVMIFKAL